MGLGNKPFEPEKLLYRERLKRKTTPDFTNTFALDTEADIEGNILCCIDNNGIQYNINNLANSLLYKRKNKSDCFMYNTNYDFGFFIKQLPYENAKELSEEGATFYEGITYSSKGDTHFSIKNKHATINFWDLSAVLQGSLESISQKYLSLRKIPLDYDLITPEYFKCNRFLILKACENHAYLTYQLFLYLNSYLKSIGINTNKLYSTASIASIGFNNNCKIASIDIAYRNHLDFIHAFQNCYRGGLFTNPYRGKGYGYLYDVVSMYPSFMQNLPSIRGMRYVKSNDYQSNAFFGALLCRIQLYDLKIQPVGLWNGYMRYYPCGVFPAWIIKQEYDYLISIGAKIDILQGFWLIPSTKTKPFCKYVNFLFKEKSRYKKTNPMLSYLNKIILNSFYGKTIQLNILSNGTIQAGSDYNPMYGSYITAMARIKMSEISRKIPGLTYLIQTDSIITNIPIPPEFLSSELGGLELISEGDLLITASGIYDIGDLHKTRSFNKKSVVNKEGEKIEFNLLDMYIKEPDKSIYTLYLKRFYSWKQAVISNKLENINKPYILEYELDLNSFYSRLWPTKTNGSKLISSLEESYPLFIHNIDLDKRIVKDMGVKCNPQYFIFNPKPKGTHSFKDIAKEKYLSKQEDNQIDLSKQKEIEELRKIKLHEAFLRGD